MLGVRDKKCTRTHSADACEGDEVAIDVRMARHRAVLYGSGSHVGGNLTPSSHRASFLAQLASHKYLFHEIVACLIQLSTVGDY